MKTIGRIFGGLGLGLLGILLVVFSVCAVFYSTLGNPSFIKHVLGSSGLYDNFVESTLDLVSAETLAQDEGGNGADEMPLPDTEPAEVEPSEDPQSEHSQSDYPQTDDPQTDGGDGGDFVAEGVSDERARILIDLIPTFQSVLSPEMLQANTEVVLDALADWFRGKTDRPEFTIDTADIRDDLTIALADYMEERLSELPPGPGENLGDEYDPLTAEYAPSPPWTREQLELSAAELTAQMPLLDEDEKRGSDLIEDPDGRSVRIARTAYWWGFFGTCMFAGLLVLVAVLTLAFGHDRRKTLRRIGHLLIPSAVILLVAGAVVALFVANLDVLNFGDDSVNFETFNEDVTHPVWATLFTDLGLVMVGFGVAYVVIATVCYIVAHVLKRRRADSSDLSPEAPAALEQ